MRCFQHHNQHWVSRALNSLVHTHLKPGPLSERQLPAAPDLCSQGNFGVLRSKSVGLVSNVPLVDPADGAYSNYFNAVLCWPGALHYQINTLLAESPQRWGLGSVSGPCNTSWISSGAKHSPGGLLKLLSPSSSTLTSHSQFQVWQAERCTLARREGGCSAP